MPYNFSTLRAAAGFPQGSLASPAGRTAWTALVWQLNLARRFTELPALVDLMIPTCSASWEKGILIPFIVMGETTCQ